MKPRLAQRTVDDRKITSTVGSGRPFWALITGVDVASTRARLDYRREAT